MNADIWIEGLASGDAEVYVDGHLTYYLRDQDRSIDSTGETFTLTTLAGSPLGDIRRAGDPVDQIRALLATGVDVT